MMHRTIFLVFFILLLNIPAVRAQQPAFTNFTVENGLPSNEIYDVFEDSSGYIWFATDHGISRYDGYGFKNYSTADGLVHNTVFGFFEDVHHRVWMRMFNSALCYMENGKIYPYQHNEMLQRFLGRNFIQSFAIDSAGDLWFMSIRSPFGLYHQHHQTGKIERVVMPPGYNAVVMELGGNKVIGAVDLENKGSATSPENKLKHTGNCWFFHIVYNQKDMGRSLVRMAADKSGSFIFSFNESITEVRDGKLKQQFQFQNGNTVNNLFYDREGNYWIGQQGVKRFKPGTLSENIPAFFEKYNVNAIKEDRRGNFWFVSGNAGVLFVSGLNIMLQNKLADKAGELILAETAKDDLFLISRSGNMYHLALNGGQPDSVFDDFGPGKNGTIANCLTTDKNKELLFAGLIKIPVSDLLKNKKYDTYNSLVHGTGQIGPCRSLKITADRIIAGSNNGWGLYDTEGNALHLSQSEGFKKFCTAVALDNTQQCWIGTIDGLCVFKNGKTTPYNLTDSIFRQRVTDIAADKFNGVVVSTRGAGIIYIDGEKHYSLREADGLTTDLCGNIVIDDSIIWVCSNKGLNRILRKEKNGRLTFEIKKITVFHGLPSNMINDVVAWKNLIILATGKGLVWFDKAKTGTSHFTPAVFIEDVYANQKAITQETKLKYNENNLAFSFIGLLYNMQGNVEYRYRLDGYDTAWNYTSERTIRYFNIPDGPYRFIVSAKNENGYWNENPAGFSFAIPAHFSQTWWFRALFILACIIVIWLGVTIYIRQRRLRERMTSDMLLAELKTLRSQMKPHFIFNSLNSIQHFILERDEEAAHIYLTHFSSLMRKILDNTRQNTISLESEIETLRLYLELEKLRFGENFRYTIQVAPDIIPDMIEIPPMLIQPYTENAIWHGLLLQKVNPELKISFTSNGHELICVIEDNGIGRVKSQELQKQRKHKSAGMKNIEERVAILNRVSGKEIKLDIEDLYHADGTASGTRVIIRLPLNHIENELN